MHKKDKKLQKRAKRPIRFQHIAILVGGLAALFIYTIQSITLASPVSGDMSYLNFKQLLDDNQIIAADIVDSQKTFVAYTIDGASFNVINPGYDEFKKDILEAGVDVKVRTKSGAEVAMSVIMSAPFILLTFALAWMIGNTLGRQTSTLFRVLKPEDIVTFADVAGMSETKTEVEFAVAQIKNRKKLKEIGARPCKGIILEGPPGTGKTMLAKAIAGEAGVPFISTSGSDFTEMFVGLGASRVRALWELAELNAPCVIFIDEIDAVGRRRSSYGDGASVDNNQTLNALLQKMDGLGVTEGVFVVGATNRIEDLDPALLRPGRFDKHLYVGPPKTKKDRDEIINVHMKGKKVCKEFDFNKASRSLFGFSGAEIEQALNEAVLISVREDRDGVINNSDIEKASMKLRLSGVAISHSSEQDRMISAVHECGHAIMTLSVGINISKISIVPYSSGVGGLTIRDTDKDDGIELKTKTELLNEIAILLAGREAEQLLFGEASIGCSNDVEKATMIAYRICNEFAMIDENIASIDALRKLGISTINNSEITNNINKILKYCSKIARTTLDVFRDKLEELKDRLISEENIYDIDLSYLTPTSNIEDQTLEESDNDSN